MDVHVRGIDRQVWEDLRVQAIRQGISVAKLIEQMWQQHVQKASMLSGRGKP